VEVEERRRTNASTLQLAGNQDVKLEDGTYSA